MSCHERHLRFVGVELGAIFKLISCSHCAKKFDLSTRIPRVLHCGHHFCTACLTNLIEAVPPNSAVHTASSACESPQTQVWRIVCPTDSLHTTVADGDAATLNRSFATIEALSGLQCHPFRIYIKTMGGDILPLFVTADELVLNVKARISWWRAEFEPTRQRLAILARREGEGDGEHVVLNDGRSLRSHEIGSETMVALMMVDADPGGLVRTLGASRSLLGRFSRPHGVCLAPGAHYLLLEACCFEH